MTTFGPDLVQPRQATIGLPRERLIQLQSLAKKREITIVGLIESFISKAIEAGEITDEIEGFEVKRGDFDRIHITVRGTAFPFVSAGMANTIASVLEAAAGKSQHAYKQEQVGFEVKPDRLVPISLNEDLEYPASLGIMRHGKAVMLSFRGINTPQRIKTAFTLSLAFDLARQIRTVAHAQ